MHNAASDDSDLSLNCFPKYPFGGIWWCLLDLRFYGAINTVQGILGNSLLLHTRGDPYQNF